MIPLLNPLSRQAPGSRPGDFRHAIATCFLATIPALLFLLGLGGPPAVSGSTENGGTVPQIRFEEVAVPSGVDFVLENFPTPEKHMIQTMPGGVAIFDYNGNGLLDIFFTNGAAIPSMSKKSPRFYNRLYRNEGGMRFTDVTEDAGVAGDGYSMGVAIGDFDNDGHPDIFVAGVFHNILYRNRGDGTFEDVTLKAGIESDLWAVAAGWFDYDNDGYLDLFVVNYVEWSTDFDRFCGDRNAGVRVYCHPRYFTPVRNTLYRNRGDGTFENVTEKAGIAPHLGKGMSVAFEDYDRDGLIDAFVTNDTLPNFLFRNRGDGTFEEVGLLAGAALREHGKPVSSMGVDFRDYDNDGLPDISVTALAGETFPLFRNLGNGLFTDATYPSGIARLAMPYTGWSNGFFDFNNNGWKDLFAANSHVNDRIEHFEAIPYKQSNTVFANRKDGTFEDHTPGAGEAFQVPMAHRGAAFGDLNNNGKIDAVVTSLGDRAQIWKNVTSVDNSWIILRLEGTRSNRDGIGTHVYIGEQYNIMTTAVGYASSSHSGVHFGMGDTEVIGEIRIEWPSGTVQVLRDVPTNQLLYVEEDAG